MTIALDGTAHGNFNATSGAVALATTIDADEIIVAVAIANGSTQTVSSVTSDVGVTFQKRTAKVNGTSVNVEIWYGGWGSHGTINITVNLSASAKFTVCADGISGLPVQSAIFDANAACPKDISGTGTAVTTGTVGATTSTADFGYCAVGIISNVSQSLTKGNVYGTAATSSTSDHTGTTSSDVYGGLEYLVLASAKTNVAGTWTAGSSQAYAVILDAIVGYSTTDATSATAAGAATETFIANSVAAATGAGVASAADIASAVAASSGAGSASASDIASAVAATTGAGQSAATSLASGVVAAAAGGQASAAITDVDSTVASAAGAALASALASGVGAASAAGASAATATMSNPAPATATDDDGDAIASSLKVQPWWAKRPPQWVTWTRSTSIELVGTKTVIGTRRIRLKGSRQLTSKERSIGRAAKTLRSTTSISGVRAFTESSAIKLPGGRTITASSSTVLETKKRYNELLDILVATGVFDE